MVMGRTFDSIILFIAQGAYSGRFPKAPGTAGTFIGVLLYLTVKDLSSLWYGVLCAVVSLAGTAAASRAECILGEKDSPSIVIDEIEGFLVALFLIPFSWWAVAAGFVLFRFFDIFKPWPIRTLQEIPGGPGVMLDDIGAGVITNIILQAITFLMDR